MKLSCPICSRQTDVERDIGDFLTRCNCCGNLVRFPAGTTADVPEVSGGHGAINKVALKKAMPARMAVAEEASVEMDHIRARRVALARAAKKGRQEAMGTLGWIGLGVAAVLAVIAISVKAQNVFNHPASASANTMMMR